MTYYFFVIPFNNTDALSQQQEQTQLNLFLKLKHLIISPGVENILGSM